MSELNFPLLRAVDVRRVEQDGAPFFLLRDPLHLGDQQLHVSQLFGPALALFDGSNAIDDIAALVRTQYGLPMESRHVQSLADALDEACMLESPRFRQRYAEAVTAFRCAPSRPPALAGSGYPAERDDLEALLQSLLDAADDVEPAPVDWAQGVGLLSPHIDYGRGGPVYAQVWKRAANAVAGADVAVIFGTDHFGNDLFTLTRQSYATPYGTLPTDTAVVDALAAALGEQAAFAGELRHRGEHSLELVAVWLHHMRGGMRGGMRAGMRAGKPLPIVPILVGSLQHHMENGAVPQDDPQLAAALAALKSATAGRRVLYVASGDLAHVGPAFGGAPLYDAQRAMVRRADSALLHPMLEGNAAAFFAEIKRVQNRNNVCGVTPIYLTLRALGAVRGTQLGYAHCPADDAGTSIVSVAGVMFQGKAP